MSLAYIVRNTSATLGRCLIFALFLSPFTVHGEIDGWFLDDDLNYAFESGSSTHVYVWGLKNSFATHITIPSTVVCQYYNDFDDEGNPRVKRRTCRVMSITDSAFNGCSGLTSVTIPDSVTSIGSSAFSGCSGLTSMTIPSSITSVPDYAFRNCSSLTNVTIPDSVTSIGYAAFRNCSSLTSVTIPDSVTSIGDWAFEGCSGLTSVTIGNGVTSIGNYAFGDCSGIKSVTVPQSVLDYRQDDLYEGGVCLLFENSRASITNVAFSGVITNIGEYTFSYCKGLLRVTIPDTVKGIGDYAFHGCSGLTSVTIPNSVTSIGDYAFEYCSGLTSVTIPDSVTSIGDWAFEGCSGLTSMTIPSSITSVPDYAFRNCSSLTNVTIPDSVTSLGREAFSGCSSLTKVSIPESVTYFGASCFEGCPVYTLPLYRMVLGVGGSSGGGGGAEPADPRYALAASPADRAIASVTVDRDCAIDSFVLTDGKVYDTVLRIVNTSESEVRLTLPSGYAYETFKGAKPLTIPANSRNMLTITRTADDTFLVSREELETVR